MDYDSIMQEIVNGLTGNQSEDKAYLNEQREKYKGHPLHKEILREIGRILFKITPREDQIEFSKVFQKEMQKHFQKVNEALKLKLEGRFEDAVKILEPEVKVMEELYDHGFFKNDSVSEYYVFKNLFEETLFYFRKKPERTVRKAEFDFGEMYFTYGNILFDLNRIDDAQDALLKAKRWNPSNGWYSLEYAETLKRKGELENFLAETKHAFSIAYTPSLLGRCYRNLGYYFIEKYMWQEAIECYTASLIYDKEKVDIVDQEFGYIYSKTGEKFSPSTEHLKEYADKYDFPLGANRDVVLLAYHQGKRNLEEKNFATARFFLEIAYGLVKDDEIKALLESIPSPPKETNKGPVLN